MDKNRFIKIIKKNNKNYLIIGDKEVEITLVPIVKKVESETNGKDVLIKLPSVELKNK